MFTVQATDCGPKQFKILVQFWRTFCPDRQPIQNFAIVFISFFGQIFMEFEVQFSRKRFFATHFV